LALGLVAVTTVLRVRGRQEAEQLIAGPVLARRAIAVLGFANNTGRPESAWLSTALAEMLTTELGGAKSLRILPGELVARARLELGLTNANELDAAGRGKLRALLGADYFVLGGYTALGASAGGQVRLDLRLQDARAGEVLATYGEDGTEAQLFDIVRKAGAALRERLGAGGTAATGFWSAARWTPEATRLYAEGIAHLRAFEPRAAREVLERAVAADPESPLAHAALADAWGALGYQELARTEARKAFELAAALPAEERLEIEGRYRDRTGEAARAVEIYAELFSAHPDDVDIGLRLASALTAAGRGQDALATLATLRTLATPGSEDPRLHLAEAVSAGALGDFARQRTAATAAATAAAAKGAQLQVARARMTEGSALRNLGDLVAAETAGREAAALFAATGDRVGEADALWVIGTTRFDRGDLAGARALYDDALAVFREVGDQAGTARVLNSAAVVARQGGDLAGARAQYEKVLVICRETADPAGVSASLGNLGTVALQEGQLAAALEKFEESLALRRQLPDQAGLASALANTGVALRRLGRLAEARRLLEESLAIRRQTGQKIASAASLSGLGRLLLDLGDLAVARSSFTEALALAREGGSKSVEALALAGSGEVALASGDLSAARVEIEQSLALRGSMGERLTAAESRLLLAGVLLEEGQVAEALTAVRAARAEFVELGATDLQLLAAALEVRSLMVQGETPAARAAAQAARALAERSQSPPARWALRVARAELAGELALSRPAARAELAAVAREATAMGFLGLAWEARLLAAEMAGASAGQEFAAIAREADAAGFRLLAGKARRAG
jgi:eukaryotic-like serine/threonine-protein kinase